MFPRILTDRGIRKLIESEQLIIDPFPDLEQFQPCSIDFRIGHVDVYDEKSIQENQLAFSDIQNNEEDFLAKLNAADRVNSQFNRYDDEIFIPSGSMFEVYFKEKMNLPDSHGFVEELRSSSGRQLLRPTSTLNLVDNYIRCVNDNVNDIILKSNAKFSQRFIVPNKKSDYTGELVTSKTEALDLFPEFDSDYITENGELLFKVKEVLEYNKIKEPYVAGGEFSNLISKKEFTDGKNFLEPNKAYLLKLNPEVDTKNHLGVMLLHSNPYASIPFANKVVCAGWVDPGYKGFVTGHYKGLLPRVISENEPVVAGRIYNFKEGAIDNLYGSKSLNSHYKDTKGKIISNN